MGKLVGQLQVQFEITGDNGVTMSGHVAQGASLPLGSLPSGTYHVRRRAVDLQGTPFSGWSDWNDMVVTEDPPEATCVQCMKSKPLGQMRWTSDPYHAEIYGTEVNEGWWCEDCYSESAMEV